MPVRLVLGTRGMRDGLKERIGFWPLYPGWVGLEEEKKYIAITKQSSIRKVGNGHFMRTFKLTIHLICLSMANISESLKTCLLY